MFKGPWAARWRRAETDPLGRALGSLERDVMEVVWRGRTCTVRDVHAALDGRVAYTTVMTTLDRLFKKGFLSRTRWGRAFAYDAVENREQVEARLTRGLLSGLLSSRPDAALPVFSHLVDRVAEQESAIDLLDALEALVRERRRRLLEGTPEEDA